MATKAKRTKKSPTLRTKLTEAQTQLAETKSQLTQALKVGAELSAEVEAQPARIYDEIRERFSKMSAIGLTKDASEVCFGTWIGPHWAKKYISFEMMIQSQYAGSESYTTVGLHAEMPNQLAHKLTMLRATFIHHAKRIDQLLETARIEGRGRVLNQLDREPVGSDADQRDSARGI